MVLLVEEYSAALDSIYGLIDRSYIIIESRKEYIKHIFEGYSKLTDTDEEEAFLNFKISVGIIPQLEQVIRILYTISNAAVLPSSTIRARI